MRLHPLTKQNLLPLIHHQHHLGPHFNNPYPGPFLQTRSKTGISKKKIFLISSKHQLHPALLSSLETREPTSYTRASKIVEWRQAMDHEFNSLQKLGTWSLVPYKPTVNIVGNKWVYKIKCHVNASISRYKARLVAKGFHQQP